jgi:hypothetical protein
VPYHIEHGKAEVLGDPEPEPGAEPGRSPPSSDSKLP